MFRHECNKFGQVVLLGVAFYQDGDIGEALVREYSFLACLQGFF